MSQIHNATGGNWDAPSTAPRRDCVHGQLARSCEICDLRAQLAQREAELAALREKARAWEALAREAVEEFDDARRYASDGYASEYFTKKWDYNETSVRFQERLAALSDNQEGRDE